MFIFEDVYNSPLKYLIDPAHRNKIASEVNSAILTSQNHEKGKNLFPNFINGLCFGLYQFDHDICLWQCTNHLSWRWCRGTNVSWILPCLADPKLPAVMKMLIWAQNLLDEKAIYPRITDLSTGTLQEPST